jgi:ribosome-binding factor A
LKPSKKTKKGTLPCDEIREGDGIPPRHIKKRAYHQVKPNYQNSRVCKQIETVLALLFSGGSNDDRFNGLFVDSVEQLSDMSFLLITVIPIYREQASDPDGIIQFLESAKPFLRKEVAAEINRKRMPDFRFKVVIDPEMIVD